MEEEEYKSINSGGNEITEEEKAHANGEIRKSDVGFVEQCHGWVLAELRRDGSVTKGELVDAIRRIAREYEITLPESTYNIIN